MLRSDACFLSPGLAELLGPTITERGGQRAIARKQNHVDHQTKGRARTAGEIASSSASIDLGAKLRVYQRNQIQEYLVWRVRDRAIDWFRLRHGQYEPLVPGPDGIFRSEVFPGLWLDPAAMLDADLATVFAILQQGLASPEHTAFVARLEKEAMGAA